MFIELHDDDLPEAAKRKPKMFRDCEDAARNNGWDFGVTRVDPQDHGYAGWNLRAFMDNKYSVYVSVDFNWSTGRWRVRWGSLAKRPDSVSESDWNSGTWSVGVKNACVPMSRATALWLLENPDQVAEWFDKWIR